MAASPAQPPTTRLGFFSSLCSATPARSPVITALSPCADALGEGDAPPMSAAAGKAVTPIRLNESPDVSCRLNPRASAFCPPPLEPADPPPAKPAKSLSAEAPEFRPIAAATAMPALPPAAPHQSTTAAPLHLHAQVQKLSRELDATRKRADAITATNQATMLKGQQLECEVAHLRLVVAASEQREACEARNAQLAREELTAARDEIDALRGQHDVLHSQLQAVHSQRLADNAERERLEITISAQRDQLSAENKGLASALALVRAEMQGLRAALASQIASGAAAQPTLPSAPPPMAAAPRLPGAMLSHSMPLMSGSLPAPILPAAAAADAPPVVKSASDSSVESAVTISSGSDPSEAHDSDESADEKPERKHSRSRRGGRGKGGKGGSEKAVAAAAAAALAKENASQANANWQLHSARRTLQQQAVRASA